MDSDDENIEEVVEGKQRPAVILCPWKRRQSGRARYFSVFPFWCHFSVNLHASVCQRAARGFRAPRTLLQSDIRLTGERGGLGDISVPLRPGRMSDSLLHVCSVSDHSRTGVVDTRAAGLRTVSCEENWYGPDVPVCPGLSRFKLSVPSPDRYQ